GGARAAPPPAELPRGPPSPRPRLVQEPERQLTPEAVAHQLLHHVLECEALRVVGIDEPDAHARIVTLGVAPRHLAQQLEWILTTRNGQLEEKARPHRQGLARLDERAGLADVARVVGEEAVQLLVVDLQLDRRPRVGAPVRLWFRHWGRGRSIRTSDATRRALGPGAAPTTRRVGPGAGDCRRRVAGGPPSSLRAARPGAGPRRGHAVHAPRRLARPHRDGGAAGAPA